MNRRPVSRGESKRIFRQGNRVHPRNITPPMMRGGYRL